MRQQPLTHVSIQILPNFGNQHGRTCDQEHADDRQEKPARRATGRFAFNCFPHMKVMMKKHVEAKVVREVLRSDHQTKRNRARRITTRSSWLVHRRDLLCAYEEEECEQHEEDE